MQVMLCRRTALTLILAFTLGATTLEKLSMDDMIARSTAIVRGQVTASAGEYRGGMVFTRYRVQVAEVWKGKAGGEVDVFVPGGVAQNFRQTVPGAPVLEPGIEYVMFLWTGASGRTQVIGLSQGLFTVKQGVDGTLLMERPGVKEMMLDPRTGMALQDRDVSLRLVETKARVAKGASR